MFKTFTAGDRVGEKLIVVVVDPVTTIFSSNANAPMLIILEPTIGVKPVLSIVTWFVIVWLPLTVEAMFIGKNSCEGLDIVDLSLLL